MVESWTSSSAGGNDSKEAEAATDDLFLDSPQVSEVEH